MKAPDFTLEQAGDYFVVLVFDDYVIKVSRNKNTSKERLKAIAEIQTQASEQIPGILPCYYREGALVMPKAPGIRVDKIKCPEKLKHINRQKDHIVSQVKALGYDIHDSRKANLFYDEENDQLYIIDFHLAKGVRPMKGR